MDHFGGALKTWFLTVAPTTFDVAIDVDVDVDIDIVNVYFDGPLKTWIESLHLQL